MKYFLLLVQERGAKIPASVLEVVALAAPPSPYLSVVLLGMFDCESRCFASEVPLSDTSYFLVLLSCALWLHKFLQSFWQHQLPSSLLLAPRKARTKICSSEKHCLESKKVNPDASLYAVI